MGRRHGDIRGGENMMREVLPRLNVVPFRGGGGLLKVGRGSEGFDCAHLKHIDFLNK